MGREVRMVPPYWVHPKYDRDHPEVAIEGRHYLIGRYIPMHNGGYEYAIEDWEKHELPEWEEGKRLWDEGFVNTYMNGFDRKNVPIQEYLEYRAKEERYWNPVPENPDYIWWAGEAPERPNLEDYMPNWPDEECTHFMMYEDTSEGTPISPAFETPEELARWLADTGASAFADYTATYEQWLATIKRGWAVSAIMDSNGMHSGVEGMAEEE